MIISKEDQTLKFVESGDIVQHSAADSKHYYTLQGVKVAQPTRGLYILNGKKMIVR